MKYNHEEHFITSVHYAAHSWRLALDRRLREFGLGRSGWMAISAIARAESLLSQIEISNLIGVEGATMVTTLDRLESSGLVTRTLHPSDRRIKQVNLTESGLALYHRLQAVADAARQELLAGLAAEEMAMATRLLERIREAAEKIR
ncbi:MAG: MarR family transcriptional regulator [Fluviicoccus sp.]|uniref:MarR family winged helix-turn-helix transcriptional regulator n=1 Tax=Fluviicoccus sp. TaxID=2003552 RepID=UPI0027218557|nr:MarR family transcriptional regulator [Fluviicoccus sp.]MDO8330094.1 MarR family transcriptional regulator [Fluviicoccus sp.]